MTIELPWIEKYRPYSLKDVIGQKEIISRLESYVKNRNVPNMLFSGPAGVGKTSASVALAKELFGEEFERNFMELNASDERGIDVVRKTIKDFARTLAFNADFKIIFLDESDALTRDAQQALRRTMEKYTKTCRFVLSCVTPDTKIVLPEEIETTVGEFMERFEEKKQNIILAKNENSEKIGNEQVICCIQQNPKNTGKQVFELTTNSGRKIKATNDHLLLTSQGWKKVGNLSIDDKLVIFPYLEGTWFEEDKREIIDLDEFTEFLERQAEEKGYKKLANAKKFEELLPAEKQKIISRAKGLLFIVENGQGLTKREYQIYRIIKRGGKLARKQVQEKIKLSRIRTVQLLREIERKGFIKRTIGKNPKVHSFELIEKRPLQLRNTMDIKNLLEKESGIKISYCGIKKHLEKTAKIRGGFETALQKLNEQGLLGLKYTDKKIGAFTRIFSFIYGDGHISKSHRKIIFTGNRYALKEVKEDLKKLGFCGSEITTKQLKNTILGRSFIGKTTSFYVDSNSFIKLLVFLGAPAGDKVVKPYKVPPWIMNGTKFVKREFLRSIYGCEGDSPRIKNKNFEALTLRMHKSRELKQNMLEFYGQIKIMLEEFGVHAYVRIRKLGTIRKDGHTTDSYELFLESSNKNLFKFFSRIGYAFEREKIKNARLAAEYLKCKLYCLEQQKSKAAKILQETGNLSKRAIARRYGCSADFVINQFKGKTVHLPRNFASFEEWKRKFDAGNEFVFNELIEIKEIECNDVRDVSCAKNHNFIANGIIAHNCNYSSRIIEPIQSRCVVFRFKPLPSSDIEKRLSEIAAKEKVEVNKKALEAIIYVSMGDMRKAVNILQAASTIDKVVSEKNVFDVSSRARPEEIREMISFALKGKFLEAREKLDTLMYEHGMSGEDVMLQLYREVMEMDEKELDGKTKIALVDIIGEYNFRMVEGANERIQLEALLAQFMKFKK